MLVCIRNHLDSTTFHNNGAEMELSSQILTLAQYMTGEFSNHTQAIADPAWYVNLRLWQQPLDGDLLGGIALFAEQANIINLDKPYRQRVLHLFETDGAIKVQYFAFRNPSAWVGAGADPERLTKMAIADLEELPQCVLDVTSLGVGHFKAELPPDAKCCFSYLGETRQVSLGFEATATAFLSYDKGIDMNTGAAIWGAIAGAYHFTKI